MHDILVALANGQVDTVFLSAGFDLHSEEEDFHPAIPPALNDLPGDRGVRITDALVTRAHQTGAKVRFTRSGAAGGGVGAALRYRL